MTWRAIITLAFLLPFFQQDLFAPVAAFLYAGLGVISLVYAAMNKSYLRTLSVLIPLLVFTAIAVLTSFFSDNPAVSLSHAFYFFIYMIIFFSLAGLEPKRKSKMLLALLAASFFISINCLLQHFFYFDRVMPYIVSHRVPITSKGLVYVYNTVARHRAISFFNNPNLLASYLAMADIITIGFIFYIGGLNARKTPAFWGLICLFLLNSYAIWLTRSLSGVAGLLFGLIIFLLIVSYAKRGEFSRARYLSMITVFAVLVLLVLMLVQRSCYENHADSLYASARGRFQLTRTALDIISKRPLLFSGLGNFGYTYKAFAPDALIESTMAHNIILQLWIELGIYGLLAFIWFLCAFFSRALKIIRRRDAPFKHIVLKAAAFSACCAFLLHNMGGFSFFVPQASIMWWLLSATAL